MTSAALEERLCAFAAEAGDLVPEGSLASCGEATRMFGPASPEVALEVHVAEPRPTVDVTLRVHRTSASKLVLSDLPSYVGGLVSRWVSGVGALERVPFIEFEFDLATHSGLPWVGPALEPELRRGPLVIQKARDAGAAYPGPRPADADSIAGVLHELGGVDGATEVNVRTLFAALPRTGLVSQIALLHGRPSAPRQGVRAFVSVPRTCLGNMLASVGWPGDLRAVVDLMERFTPSAHWADVDFSMSATETEPQLSFYREFRAPRRRDGEIASVLASIGELALTTPEHVGAIRRWVERVDGRLDRVLTFKLTLVHRVARLKLYLSALDIGPSG